LYREANKEHAAKEINNLANAFGHASLSASSAGKPYMIPLHPLKSSYSTPKQRAKKAANAVAQQFQSIL